MKKRNENVEKLVDEISKAVGDTSKSSEIFYLLKKQGDVSTRQRGEIIALDKQMLENHRILKDYASKCRDLFFSIKQQGEISQLQQGDLIELGKRVIENYKTSREILVKLFDLAKTLKVVLPKTFDVTVKNIHDFPTEFRISNLDDIPSPPDEVHIKRPPWLSDFFEGAFKFIAQPLIAANKKQHQNIVITGPTDPKKAIAVRLSDGKRFYTAVFQAIAAGAESLDTVENLLQQILASQGGTPQVGNRYISTSEQVVTGIGDESIFLIKNPSGSNKDIRFEKILATSEKVGAGERTFKVFRNPVISSNGVSKPIEKMKSSQPASVAQSFTTPTITSNGKILFGGNYGDSSLFQPLEIPFVLMPGENMLFVCKSPTDRIFITAQWIEE